MENLNFERFKLYDDIKLMILFGCIMGKKRKKVTLQLYLQCQKPGADISKISYTIQASMWCLEISHTSFIFQKEERFFYITELRIPPLDEPFCDNLPFIIFVKDRIHTKKKHRKKTNKLVSKRENKVNIVLKVHNISLNLRIRVSFVFGKADGKLYILCFRLDLDPLITSTLSKMMLCISILFGLTIK